MSTVEAQSVSGGSVAIQIVNIQMANNKGFTLVPWLYVYFFFFIIFPRVTSVNLESGNVYKSNYLLEYALLSIYLY